jgi:drug/metabolite transporter (DMT)-like permease
VTLGLAFAILGAILFSTKAVVVKLAYAFPVTPEALLALRLLFALPFYLFVATRSARSAPPLTRADWLKVISLGLIGYYGASLLDFWGLAYISAGLERLTLYTYPVIVILLSAVAFGRPVTGRDALAFGAAYLGVAFVVLNDRVRLGAVSDLSVGVLLVLLSAFAYAVYLVGSQHIIPRLGAIRFTALAMPAATVGALTHFALTDSAERLFAQPAAVYGYALFLAVFSTVLPSFLISAGLARIGAARTAMVGAIGPIATMLIAWPLLGETITATQLLGSALVVYGVGVANGGGRR